MTFLAILLAIALDKVLDTLETLRNFTWLPRFVRWVDNHAPREFPWQGTTGLLVLAFAPTAAVGLVQYLLHTVLELLSFLFSIAVLVYCLWPQDTHRHTRAFMDASLADDETEAHNQARTLLDEVPADPAVTCQRLTELVVVQDNDRLYGVLFWFAVLGPVGALLFRVASLLHTHTDRDTQYAGLAEPAHRLYGILAWLPAHVAALGYALAGSFVDAASAWRAPSLNSEPWWNLRHSRAILREAGLGALQVRNPDDPQSYTLETVKSALGLAARSLVLWVVVLALLTLGGLVS